MAENPELTSAGAPKKKLVWDFSNRQRLLAWSEVATVCEESRCPNRYECSGAGIATFMIGGKDCTRACKFCHINTLKPAALTDEILAAEKAEILKAVDALKLRFVVVTSVARDDAEEKLARHFADITGELNDKGLEVELLIPDFHAKNEFLDIIGNATPLVIAQNMETVRRLSRHIRPQAAYERTLVVFDHLHSAFPGIFLKSGIMVGLGENKEEIRETLEDLRSHHVEIVTIGQYMRPSSDQEPVHRVYSADEFEELEKWIEEIGFSGWEAGPYVRSSYMAGRTMDKVRQRRKSG